jgi:ribonuclease HII
MIVAGVDEVGRGPLAGPVIAAAVVLPSDYQLPGLTDSKRISVRLREILSGSIKDQAIAWSIGRCEVDEIDRINIFNAALLAMKRAVESLSLEPELSLIDGRFAPRLPCKARAIVKGDLSEPCISAASIVAKVERDRIMCELHNAYPGYEFDRNKGYATHRHLEALGRRGACEIHRRSFSPVREALLQKSLDLR